MLKYVNTGIVFQEIPDEVTLSVNISNCPCRCPGCHSQYLWRDIGTPLTADVLDGMIARNGGDMTCVCFMGGDAEPEAVSLLARHVHSRHPQLKVAWYSGRQLLPRSIDRRDFDYIKVGPYIRHLGPLNKPTTNQRLYRCAPDGTMTDITSRFWRKP